MSEKLELYDGPSIEERQELDALSRLSPEMLGLSGELANMQATIIKAKKQIIDDMPEGMPMSQAVVKHDMQALYSVIQTAGLMADGIITRIRQFKSGRFTE
ncbi:hypothetical protein SAMN06295888_1452 [Desulfonatronum zhilinae]|nr:hypothetical protein SAMN06295888_1452 [Desulfonatronum zhilinae]